MTKTTFLCAILFILTNSLYSGTGKISGKVTDIKTSEPLIGVSVLIENTRTGAMTDLEGRYVIDDVEEGTYRLAVNYIAYKSQIVQDVQVKAKETSSVNIYLEESASEIGEVVLTASANTNSVTNLFILQQKNLSITSGVSQEDIKRSPDKNTSEVLRRISGASIQENKFVIIRGLSDRYNTALINGMPLPTSEPDRKAFSFDIFPSAMVDNLLIYKTATPDLPGDFAGGVIQVNTRDIPDDPFVNISAGTGYNTLSTFKTYKTYHGGKGNWLGTDDGTRNLLNGIPGTDTMKSLLSSTLNQEIRNEASHYLDSDWSKIHKESSPLNQSYQLSMGGSTKVFKNDFGAVMAVTYNHSRKNVLIERADFDIDTGAIYRYTDNQYKENVLMGGMLNFAYKIGENNKLSLKNMMNINAEDMVVERTGTHFENDRYEKGTTLQYTSNAILTSQLSGDHYLPKSKIKLKWGGSYTKMRRDVPNLRRVMSFQSFGDTVWYAAVSSAPSPNYAGIFFSDLHDKIYTANADASIPFVWLNKKHTLKFGGSTQYKVRGFNARAFGYKISNTSKFEWSLLSYGHDSIFSSENIGRADNSGFMLAETTNPSDNYNASSNLHAGFIMFENNITKKLRFIWGARAESYSLHLDAFEYDGDTVAIDTSYFDLLPSANIIYAVNDRSNIRFAVSKTLCRPEFREIAPFSFFDFNTFSAVVGNDTLQPTKIMNYDFKYEIYPGFNQMLAISAFYKNFTNPIENIMYYGGSGSRSRSLQNVKRAVNYGLELEYRYKLSLLDSLFGTNAFSDITFSSNLAYIYSSVDMNGTKGIDTNQMNRQLQGQSPYLINAGLQYISQQYGAGISLLFNRYGRRISEVGSNGYSDIYETPRSLFDIQLSKRLFHKKTEVKFTIADAFSKESVFYQDENNSKRYEKNADKKISGMKFGTNYSFSFSYSF